MPSKCVRRPSTEASRRPRAVVGFAENAADKSTESSAPDAAPSTESFALLSPDSRSENSTTPRSRASIAGRRVEVSVIGVSDPDTSAGRHPHRTG